MVSRLVEVEVPPTPLERLAPYVLPDREIRLAEQAVATRALLAGRSVVNVNSTAVGGGVAELVHSAVAYSGGAGLDVRWLVIHGDALFFEITKRIHNRLHGDAGDGGTLGDSERVHYETVLAANAEELKAVIRDGDVVILHDPQTVGLARVLKEIGAIVIWRCHVGGEHGGDVMDETWAFLRPYVEPADAYVFSMEEYSPEWLDRDRLMVIHPSIDPSSAKNVDMSSQEVENILTHVGLIAGDPLDAPATFTRSDGSIGRMNHYADVIQAGSSPHAGDPMVLQVSRWDNLKDMAGVMEAFVRLSDKPQDAHLILAGPVVTGVADDPEASVVFNDCVERWRQLPHAERRRVQLACLPMVDGEENAAIVNALQRHATVILQKSLAEGFGLTVTEAMWKGKPVIGSDVGAIAVQLIDGETGFLLADPTDLDACSEAIGVALHDGKKMARFGNAARERVRKDFLTDRDLLQYAELIARLVTS